MRKLLPLLLLVLLHTGVSAPAKKKKEPKEVTQTLPVLRDPPVAVAADTGRLAFRVSPLLSKGLLSRQVRDALKVLLKDAKDEPVVKLRAFTAGSGDARRVQTIVSEMYSDKHLQLPALSVAQVGALPLAGAQVAIEATSVARRPVNPYGLAFLSGLPGADAEQAATELTRVLQAGGMEPKDVLRLGCFVSSLENGPIVFQRLRSSFPSAAVTLAQRQRIGLGSSSECEAVARLRSAPPAAVGTSGSSGPYSQMVRVNVPQLAFTGSQLAFGRDISDVRIAFERLHKDLQTVHSSLKDTVMAHMYTLSNSVSAQVAKIRFDFYDQARPPAGAVIEVEGLPSIDATFAVDAVAVVEPGR